MHYFPWLSSLNSVPSSVLSQCIRQSVVDSHGFQSKFVEQNLTLEVFEHHPVPSGSVSSINSIKRGPRLSIL